MTRPRRSRGASGTPACPAAAARGPQQELTHYLLKAGGDHIGNLGFSESREEVPQTRELPGIEVLAPARAVLAGLEAGRPVDPALSQIVRPNTGLGGTRPKISIEHEGRQWIAKFPAREDKGAPIARIERAMLALAAECGIRTAHAVAHEGDILLVERFDRTRAADGQGWRRDAFVSAQTIFHANPAVQAYAFSGSYPRLAMEMARFCDDLGKEREQLFRRMVFNCCITNTDDHERNHGFLASDTPGRFVLSPAYDLVPRRHATQRREHALALGQDGFLASRANLLSDCTVFGLRQQEADRIIDAIQEAVASGWRRVLIDEGLSDEEIADWAGCFAPLADSA